VILGNIIKTRRYDFRPLKMDVILWDGENTFPAKIEIFKQFLKKYLTSLNYVTRITDKKTA
jgi:hypothetical protein